MAGEFKLAAILEFVNKAGPGVKAATKEFGGLGQVAKAMGSALVAAGVVTAGKAAYELGVLGAQSLRTKRAFAAISGGALTAADNLDAMRRATRGAMSEQQMMASANRLMQMGLADNAAELEQVATMATRLGSAMGKEAGPAVEEFALMLANQSIPRLDTFGISAGKVRARILELQAATPGLSREMAFMTATMEEGEAAMGRLGETIDDELLANERLEASWADLKAMAGEALAPAMAEVADVARDIITAMEELNKETRELGGQFGDAAVEAAKAEDIMSTLSDASRILDGDISAVGSITESTGSAMDKLRQQMYDVEQIAVGRAFQEARAEAENMTPAIIAAGGAMDGLATSAKTVASSFGEMVFDDEQLWKMAAASGANLPELEELAKLLGIASSAEIEATKTAYELIEGFGEGRTTVEKLAAGFSELETRTIDAADGFEGLSEEEAIAEKGLLDMSAAEETATDTTRDLRRGLGRANMEAADFSDNISSVAYMLDQMAGDYYVTVHYQAVGSLPPPPPGVPEYQSGTAFHRGGLALIGGGRGPELVALPRGSRVWPASAPQTQAAVNNRYNYDGDTIYINDRLAAALYMESRRRNRMQRVENM